jgi:hypothetical protein
VGEEGEQSSHQVGWDVEGALRLVGLQRCAGAVASELALDPDHGVLGVEVGDGEAERLPDPQACCEQELEQAAVLLGVGVRDQGAHLFECEDPFRALVVVFGSLAALELCEGVDGDAAFAGGLGKDDRQGSKRAGDRPALQSLSAHTRDEGGDVLGADLVEPPSAEVGDQVPL